MTRSVQYDVGTKPVTCAGHAGSAPTGHITQWHDSEHLKMRLPGMIPHLHQTVFLYYPYIYKSVFGRFLLLQLSKVLPCSKVLIAN